jgi:Fe-S-cluster containining protein
MIAASIIYIFLYLEVIFESSLSFRLNLIPTRLIVRPASHKPTFHRWNSWMRPALNHNIQDEKSEQTMPFRQTDDLYFQCTGFQNEGDVWFSHEEFFDLVNILNMPIEEAFETYVVRVLGNWVEAKGQILSLKSNKTTSGCIFLSPIDGKTYTIYEFRPEQCRSYPFWSNLLNSKEAWLTESHDSGCEDFIFPTNRSVVDYSHNSNDSNCPDKKPITNSRLSRRNIYLAKESYRLYVSSFPSLRDEANNRDSRDSMKHNQDRLSAIFDLTNVIELYPPSLLLSFYSDIIYFL